MAGRDEEITPLSNILAKYEGFVTERHLESLNKRTMIEGIVRRVFLPFKILYRGNVNHVQKIMLVNDEEHLVMFWRNIEDINTIMIGDRIQLKSVKYSEKYKEFYADNRTKITVLNRAEITPLANIKEGNQITQGTIVEVYPVYYYEYGNVEKKMHSFKIMDKTAWKRIVVWESPVDVSTIKEGDVVRIENGVLHDEEIHINLLSRIIIVKKGDTDEND